jgi:hypothetical protein
MGSVKDVVIKKPRGLKNVERISNEGRNSQAW